MWRFVQYNITFLSVDFAMQAGFKLGLPVSNPVWYLVILIILQFRMCTRKNFDVLNLPVSNLIWYLVSNLIWYLVIYNNTNHNAFVGQERFWKSPRLFEALAALVPRIHLEAFPKSFLTSKSMWLVYWQREAFARVSDQWNAWSI